MEFSSNWNQILNSSICNVPMFKEKLRQNNTLATVQVNIDFTEFFFKMKTMHKMEKREILSHWKIFVKSTALFSNFFISKTVAFTKFLRKKCERISAISTLCNGSMHYSNFQILSITKNYIKSTCCVLLSGCSSSNKSKSCNFTLDFSPKIPWINYFITL